METNRITFFGSNEYSAHTLKALLEAGFSVSAVVTNPDSPQGRKKQLTPTPVKLVAQKYGLPVFQPSSLKIKNIENSLAIENLKLKIKSAALGVVVAYSKILPKEIIDLPKYGTINIHPSLLPAYRGPSPVQAAILNGETETGVSIMQIDEEVDHGPILSQAKYQIPQDASNSQVSHELFELGTELLIQTIPDYLSGRVTPKPQDHSRATFTKKFSWPDGRIDWNQPAEKTFNQIRALNPEPGTWTTFEGKILKILKASLPQGSTLDLQGSTLDLQKGRTLNLSIIPEEVQPEGKNPMSFKDFLRGIGDKEINFE